MDVFRKLVNTLNKYPYNKFISKFVYKLVSHMKDGPLKTQYGYFIDFRNTTFYPTELRKLVVTGSYERALFKIIEELVTSEDWVIDVGGYEGYISLLLWQTVGGGGRVFVVEPNPENLPFIHNNIQLNNATNIDVIAKAISSERSKMPFFCIPNSGVNGSLLLFSYVVKDKVEKIEVEVDTLDNLFGNLKRLDFLKIDTEGNELEVLLGAQKILSHHKPNICFEVSLTFRAYLEHSVDSLLNILRNHGYELFVPKGRVLCEYKCLDERIVNLFAVHSIRKSELLEKGIIHLED